MQNAGIARDKNTMVVPVATAMLLSGAVMMAAPNAVGSQTSTLDTFDVKAAFHINRESVLAVNGANEELAWQHALCREIRAKMARAKEAKVAAAAEEAALKVAKAKADQAAKTAAEYAKKQIVTAERKKAELLAQAEVKKTAQWKSVSMARPAQVSRGGDFSAQLTTKVVAFAFSLQGVQYQYGGTNPQQGLDCSALTLLAFHQVGINLPRTSSQQFRMGVGVPRSALQPGDLVFFSTNGPGASHVGIYLGNDDFISTTTNGVMIQKLTSVYWNKYYRGARRISAD